LDLFDSPLLLPCPLLPLCFIPRFLFQPTFLSISLLALLRRDRLNWDSFGCLLSILIGLLVLIDECDLLSAVEVKLDQSLVYCAELRYGLFQRGEYKIVVMVGRRCLSWQLKNVVADGEEDLAM